MGQLLAIKAFGAKCLVDLLTAFETLERTRASSTISSPPKRAHWPPCPSHPRSASATRGSVRSCGPWTPRRTRGRARAADRRTPAGNARSLAAIPATGGSPPAYRATDAVEPRGGARGDLLADDQPRDRQIVAEYHGWDGGGRQTLEKLGQKYDLSRERIRQVCVRATKRVCRVTVFAPVLDRALAYIAATAAVRRGASAARIRRCRLLAVPPVAGGGAGSCAAPLAGRRL